MPSAFGWLRWDVNRRAVASADAEVVLHAGCVAQDEHAIVISGAVGSGKSTLVAALVSEGLEYLTDEALPVDVCTGRVRAFPHPMALDDRSLDLLPEIAALPSLPDAVFHKRVVPLHPSRSALEHPSFDVAMVLFPERDASGLTIIEPVSRGEAVIRLAEECFNFPNHGRSAIDALARLAHGAVAYRVMGERPPSRRERGRRHARNPVLALRVARKEPFMSEGMSRRDLIKASAVAGATAWTAPMIIDSLSSPAAARLGGLNTGIDVFGRSYWCLVQSGHDDLRHSGYQDATVNRLQQLQDPRTRRVASRPMSRARRATVGTDTYSYLGWRTTAMAARARRASRSDYRR